METGSQEKGGTQAQSDTGDVRQGDNRQEDREKGRRGVGATRVYTIQETGGEEKGRRETGDRRQDEQETGKQTGRWECTDGNTVFRCDSDKNSLVVIYMF